MGLDPVVNTAVSPIHGALSCSPAIDAPGGGTLEYTPMRRAVGRCHVRRIGGRDAGRSALPRTPGPPYPVLRRPGGDAVDAEQHGFAQGIGFGALGLAPAAEQRDLQVVHRVDVGVAELDGAPQPRLVFEQVGLAGEPQDAPLGAAEFLLEPGPHGGRTSSSASVE